MENSNRKFEQKAKSTVLNPLIIIVLIFGLLIIGNKVWNSESFQKEYFPRSYWSRQVESLQQQITDSELYIKNTELGLNKYYLNSLFEFDKQIEINNYVAIGMNKEEAIKLVNEYETIAINIYKDLLKFSKKDLEEDVKLLKQAEQELSKYQ